MPFGAKRGGKRAGKKVKEGLAAIRDAIKPAADQFGDGGAFAGAAQQFGEGGVFAGAAQQFGEGGVFAGAAQQFGEGGAFAVAAAQGANAAVGMAVGQIAQGIGQIAGARELGRQNDILMDGNEQHARCANALGNQVAGDEDNRRALSILGVLRGILQDVAGSRAFVIHDNSVVVNTLRGFKVRAPQGYDEEEFARLLFYLDSDFPDAMTAAEHLRIDLDMNSTIVFYFAALPQPGMSIQLLRVGGTLGKFFMIGDRRYGTNAVTFAELCVDADAVGTIKNINLPRSIVPREVPNMVQISIDCFHPEPRSRRAMYEDHRRETLMQGSKWGFCAGAVGALLGGPPCALWFGLVTMDYKLTGKVLGCIRDP